MSCLVRCAKIKEVGRVFSPPSGNLLELKGGGNDMLNMVMFGVTSVEMHCKNCGNVTERILVGDHTKGSK